MICKSIGAALVIAGCGGVGFSMAAAHRREEAMLRQLIGALDFMECELQYRLTPLPELCRLASGESRGRLRELLLSLSRELEDQIAPDVESCMNAALAEVQDFPMQTRKHLDMLGRSLGRFDMEGQLRGLEAVRSSCRAALEKLTKDWDVRLRSYQTLGLCAGAALAILFI